MLLNLTNEWFLFLFINFISYFDLSSHGITVRNFVCVFVYSLQFTVYIHSMNSTTTTI